VVDTGGADAEEPELQLRHCFIVRYTNVCLVRAYRPDCTNGPVPGSILPRMRSVLGHTYLAR